MKFNYNHTSATLGHEVVWPTLRSFSYRNNRICDAHNA